jgi:hypothetical protein
MADEAIKTLAVKLALDNGTFKQGITDLKQSMAIVDTSFKASVAGVKDWGKNLDAVKAHAAALSEKINLQKQIVAKHADELDKAKKALDDNSAKMIENKKRVEAATDAYQESVRVKGKDAEETKALEKALSDATKEYKQSENAVKKNSSSVKFLSIEYNKAQGTVNEMEQELEQANAAIKRQKFNLDKLSPALKNAKEHAAKVARVMGKGLVLGAKAAAVGIGAMTVAAAAGIAAITKLTKSTLELADSVADTAATYGLSAEKVQAMTYAATKLDVTVETMFSSQTKLIRSMNAALKPTSAQAKAFETLGVAVTDANGEFRDSETVFSETITALGKVKNPTERSAIALQLLGRSAAELNPLINAGGDALAELIKEAQATGAVIDGDAIEALDNFGDTLDGLKLSLKGTAGTLISTLMPAFQGVADGANDMLADLNEKIEAADGDFGLIVDAIGDTVAEMAVKIAKNTPKVIGAIFDIIKQVVIEFTKPETIDSMISSAVSLIDGVVTGLSENAGKMTEGALRLILGLVEGLLNTDSFGKLVGAVVEIIETLTTELSKPKNLKLLTDAAVEIITELCFQLGEVIGPITEATIIVIDQIITELTTEENLEKMKDAAWILIANFALGMANGIQTLPNWVQRMLRGSPLGVFTIDMPTIPYITYQGGLSGGVARGGRNTGPSGGAMPYAVGTRYLPQDMVVQAHKGEMIVPRSENPYANSGGAIMPRGIVINFNGTIVGSDGMDEFTRTVSKKIAGEYSLALGGTV